MGVGTLRMLLGRPSALRTLVWLELCAVGRNTANVPCWSSLMNPRFHRCPEMVSYPPETHGESQGNPDAHKTIPTVSDNRTVPMHSRCPQAIPRELWMTPTLPDSPVPMPLSCPQTVSAPDIQKVSHTPDVYTNPKHLAQSCAPQTFQTVSTHPGCAPMVPRFPRLHRRSPCTLGVQMVPTHTRQPDCLHVSLKSINSQAP